MRIAFISDIHGNFTAFQSVLADIETQSIDQIVCLGDTVTMGPQPRETLDVLRKLNCAYIMGNHDAAVLDPEKADQYEITHYLVPDLYWCREQLTADDLAFIGAFEDMRSLNFPNGLKMLCFHGSPLSPTDIIQATTTPDLLDKYFEGHEADIFIGGHSHVQMTRRYGAKLILNSGSIGNAFKFAYSPGNPPSLLPWGEYMIVEQTGDLLNVESRRVYFDTDALLEIVKKSGVPGSAWWLRQYSK